MQRHLVPVFSALVLAFCASGARGDRIVFDSDRFGGKEICSMGTDGTGLVRITSDTAYKSFWGRVSPDGSKILFYRTPAASPDDDWEHSSLWMMDSDGSNRRLVRSSGTDGWWLQGHGEWSPDGSRIVMMGGPGASLHLFTCDAEGNNMAQLTAGVTGYCFDPSWSPDGSKIVCTITYTGKYEDLDVYTVPSAGGLPSRLTDNPYRCHDPYFSPDGSRIAWLVQTSTSANLGLGAWNIFTMNADGTGVTNLTNDGDINSRPEWSFDGELIYFHRLRLFVMTNFNIFSIAPDGTGLTELDPSAGSWTNEYPSYWRIAPPPLPPDPDPDPAPSPEPFGGMKIANDPQGGSVTYSNLPAGSELKLFSLSGRPVRTLPAAAGVITWDRTNLDGNDITPGIYLYVITDPDGNRKDGKLLIR